MLVAAALGASTARAADYLPSTVVVGYANVARAQADAMRAGKVGPSVDGSAATVRVIRLRRGTSVHAAITRLKSEPGVAYVVPDYIAHIAAVSKPADGTNAITGTPPYGIAPQPRPWFPNDPGRGHSAQGWERVQWNFLAPVGINAPQGWANLIADHRGGAKGVVIAVLDTGIAYTRWHQFRPSPDFTRTKFVQPYDFVSHNRFPLDREGHGTFVAGTLAASTNNGVGLTGIAYGASIMPVRVLDSQGNGDAVTIAKGIVYAVRHGAKVINLSLEFGLGIEATQIPEIISALRYANNHKVVVVAAAGNDSGTQVAYPARASPVISVGATTRDRCLAAYSNTGPRLDLVAPGGGSDADFTGEPNCRPSALLPDIFQTTFFDPSRPARFGLPNGWYGTSMAAPHVSAIAAMVIASGVIGRNPTPQQVLVRLEQTSHPLGSGRPNTDYGYGLVDAGLATSKLAPPYSIP
ncbi:MAG: S8 family serine peptidase [Solirubrobacteraceae bacterium]